MIPISNRINEIWSWKIRFVQFFVTVFFIMSVFRNINFINNCYSQNASYSKVQKLIFLKVEQLNHGITKTVSSDMSQSLHTIIIRWDLSDYKTWNMPDYTFFLSQSKSMYFYTQKNSIIPIFKKTVFDIIQLKCSV